MALTELNATYEPKVEGVSEIATAGVSGEFKSNSNY